MEQGNTMIKEKVRKTLETEKKEEQKTVRDIFKDFSSESFTLYNATILSISIYKKSNKLEIILEAENQIKLIDLEKFEIYLENRFQIKNIVIKIKYKQEFEFNISEDWQNIIDYMARKHPLTKAF